MKKEFFLPPCCLFAWLALAAEPVIKVEKKPWGTDYTLVVSDGSRDVTLVSVKPACRKYVSQMANMLSDDDYGVGVRAWDLRDEMIMADGELKVVVKGGRIGAAASVIEGPRDTLAERFVAAGRAHGAAMNADGGPMALSSGGARLSYMFAEMTAASCEDYIELARRGGQGILHFHGWWSSLGHYPVNTRYFPRGFADLTNAAAKVHAAGLKVGLHTLSGCIDFKDACLGTDAVRDLQRVAGYTLAADLAPDARELFVNERPAPLHDRLMTYSGNGNVLRIGSELVAYDDFTTEPPYAFRGLKRRWCGSRGGGHAAGTAVDYLRQRYLSFYPEPGSGLAGEVVGAIAGAVNACRADQIYFDGSEGMGTRYSIDWMRDRLYRAIGRRISVEASCLGAHNWYFHSRVNAWDYPSWGLNAFNDYHFEVNSVVRKSDLQMPQMGWWAPLQAGGAARGHLREEMEYVAGKTAALDASFSIAGVEEAFGPPPWSKLEQLTILGWYERMRTLRAFSADAVARLGVRGDEYRLRADADGVWRLQRVVREARRFVGAGGARVKLAGREPSGASLRVEALYALDESARPVALLKGGRFPGGRWKYPYFNAGGCGAFVFDVTGDGSGRTVVFTVKSPREFTAAVSEHRVKIDFTGRRRIAVFLRERDAVSIPSLSTRYSVFRNPLAAGHISEVSFAWDGGADAPPLEIGGVFACRVRRAAADRPEISVAGSRLQVPFALESGESAELENGEWTHYAENGDPVRRVKGPALTLPAGVNDIVWHSAARAEITLTAFREKIDAVAVGAATPEFDYLLPLRHEPEKGFEAKAAVPVAPGERRRLRLEILGRALRPVLTAGGRRSEFPVEMKDGDRLLCRDGRHWLLRDSRRRVLAEGEMELPLLDRPCEVSLTDSAPGRAAASVLVSTQRIR